MGEIPGSERDGTVQDKIIPVTFDNYLRVVASTTQNIETENLSEESKETYLNDYKSDLFITRIIRISTGYNIKRAGGLVFFDSRCTKGARDQLEAIKINIAEADNYQPKYELAYIDYCINEIDHRNIPLLYHKWKNTDNTSYVRNRLEDQLPGGLAEGYNPTLGKEESPSGQGEVNDSSAQSSHARKDEPRELEQLES